MRVAEELDADYKEMNLHACRVAGTCKIVPAYVTCAFAAFTTSSLRLPFFRPECAPQPAAMPREPGFLALPSEIQCRILSILPFASRCKLLQADLIVNHVICCTHSDHIDPALIQGTVYISAGWHRRQSAGPLHFGCMNLHCGRPLS